MPTLSITVGRAHGGRQPGVGWTPRWRYRRRTRGAGVRPGDLDRARGLGCRLRAVSTPSLRFLASSPEFLPQGFSRLAVTVSSRFQCEPSQGALAHHLGRVHVGIVDTPAGGAPERFSLPVLGIDVSAIRVSAARVHGRQPGRHAAGGLHGVRERRLREAPQPRAEAPVDHGRKAAQRRCGCTADSACTGNPDTHRAHTLERCRTRRQA